MPLQGYPAVGGMEKHCAMEYFAKLHMERHIFHQAWQAADRGGRGRLGERDFCLFVQLLRGAQKGRPLPAALSEGEAAALLGEAPMPGGGAAPLHIDAAHLRSVLGHSRQASLAGHEVAESVLQVGAGRGQGLGRPQGPVGKGLACLQGGIQQRAMHTEWQARLRTGPRHAALAATQCRPSAAACPAAAAAGL